MTQARSVTAGFSLPSFTIATSSNPAAGGSTSGGGSYQAGASVTVTASPATGYSFVNWTESGTAVSTSASYSFTASANRTLVANFAQPQYALSISGSGGGNGSVTSNPAGISCTLTAGSASGTCNASYAAGASVTLTAIPAGGSSFSGWSGACSGSGACTVSMTQARTVTASFVAMPPPVTITTSSTPTAGGSTSGGGTYPSGTTVTVTATPANGYQFVRWTEGATEVSTSLAYTFNATAARLLVAHFELVPYPLSIIAGGNGSGSVASSPSGINCTITAGAATGSCSAGYAPDTNVVLTATPLANNVFNGWSGACSGTGTCTVAMTQARTVTATFTRTSVLIATSSSPVVGGTTSGAGFYLLGATITLQATPAANYNFVSWTENGTVVSSGAVFSFTASVDRTLVANFAQPSYPLTVAGVGGSTGTGTITSTPAGINCTLTAGSASGPCSASYVSGTTVLLTATAVPFHSFTGWSGACTGIGTCSLSMTQQRSVAANFAGPPPVGISTSSSPAAGGTTSGGGIYQAGTTVTVVATTAGGYHFVSWTDGGLVVSTSASYTFTATANRALVANFAL
jgi:hypothetical protein